MTSHTTYIAHHPGMLPRAKHGELAGIALPPGHLHPELHLWVSDAPVAHAVSVAQELATAFSQTGIWPVLWGTNDSPTSYMGPAGPEQSVDHVNVPKVFARLWSYWRFTDPFPGMAPASGPIRATDPFSLFASVPPQPYSQDGPPFRLMLVSCRQPADTLVATGLELNDQIGDSEMSAVLRSWAARFGATPVQFGPGFVIVAAQAPPTTAEGAYQLADEIFAIAPPQGAEPTVAEMAGALVGQPAPAGDGGSVILASHVWQIYF